MLEVKLIDIIVPPYNLDIFVMVAIAGLGGSEIVDVRSEVDRHNSTSI
nr:MAG TPA_asm: hypothetical protein [Caudoviricetes sp.]